MRKLEVNQMENLIGEGRGRQCLIDGVLTYVATGLGFVTGEFFGAATGLVGGLFAANANGCFNQW